MITRDTMFVPMLEACPSFRPVWDAFVAEWGEGELPLYLALADLAQHLIAMKAAGSTGEFDAIFDVVERWEMDGDQCVKEASTIGFLEALQNTNLHQPGTVPDDFLPWLRPKSRRMWEKVEAFWTVGELIVDD